MSKSRKPEVQRMLAQAQELVDQATKICQEDELDGVSFMGQTFHCFKTDYDGELLRINEPGWYTDEYWCSSSADCEIWVLRDEEK